jgi:ferredoxin-NADP reductase
MRRFDLEMLREAAGWRATGPLTYVCGPTAFVETVADALRRLGYEPAAIKTERFGATGRER